jgi:hypothetical protein
MYKQFKHEPAPLWGRGAYELFRVMWPQEKMQSKDQGLDLPLPDRTPTPR